MQKITYSLIYFKKKVEPIIAKTVTISIQLCNPVFNSNLIHSLQAESHALACRKPVPLPVAHTNSVLEMKDSILASNAVLVLLCISSTNSTTDTPYIACTRGTI